MTTRLLKGGTVIDGTGKKGFCGHVLIEEDRIKGVFTENEALPQADIVLDAAGRVIAPGFIDMHSHSDWLLPLADHDIPLRCLPEQGVTTIVGGNCGFSPAPVTDRTRRLLKTDFFNLMVDRPLDYRWSSMDEFLDQVEQTRPVVNTAHLVGHSTVRFAHADTRRGRLTENETTECLNALEHALDQGACGVSFGLGYDPGMYSPLEELEGFCRVAAKAGKPVTVHIKALSRLSPTYPLTYLRPHNLRALKEMIDIAKRAQARLQISHLIFVGRRTWSTVDAGLDLIETARRQGLDVMFDAFPYTFGNTTVNAVLPYWFLAKLPQMYHSLWARPLLRLELAAGFFLLGFNYDDFQLMDAGSDQWEALNGLRFGEIAHKWGTSPFNVLLKLSESSNGQALALLHTYSGEPGNERALKKVLAHDLCLFQTDALIHYGGYPNPAALGAFPKILEHCVRKENLFSMEEAVRRMTSASAQRFNITDRGVIEPGKMADLVVFDPKKIAETPAVGSRPAGRPEGIDHLFINGVHAVEHGRYISGVRAGRVLRL